MERISEVVDQHRLFKVAATRFKFFKFARGQFFKRIFCAYRKVCALAMLGFGSVQAYALRRHKLAPTRVLKNWPLGWRTNPGSFEFSYISHHSSTGPQRLPKIMYVCVFVGFC
jgi:hypothetical protein